MSDDRDDAIIRIRSPEEWLVLKAALKRPEAAAKQLGVLMVKTSARAFREQKLGEHVWPPRSVFVRDSKGGKWLANVAGIVSDFNAGRTPPARRFEPRPALKDTAALQKSVAFSVTLEEGRATVFTGSVLPYASVHQSGGATSTPITPAAKVALARWIKTQEARPERITKKHAKDGPAHDDVEEADRLNERQKAERKSSLADGLRFLLHIDVWNQRVPARPFIGIPPETADKARRIVALNIANPGTEATSGDA